jgi:hypothetical protein
MAHEGEQADGRHYGQQPKSGKSTWWESLRGKKQRDIELPNESGRRDPRLPPLTPSVVETWKKSFELYIGMRVDPDPLKGLLKALEKRGY